MSAGKFARDVPIEISGYRCTASSPMDTLNPLSVDHVVNHIAEAARPVLHRPGDFWIGSRDVFGRFRGGLISECRLIVGRRALHLVFLRPDFRDLAGRALAILAGVGLDYATGTTHRSCPTLILSQDRVLQSRKTKSRKTSTDENHYK